MKDEKNILKDFLNKEGNEPKDSDEKLFLKVAKLQGWTNIRREEKDTYYGNKNLLFNDSDPDDFTKTLVRRIIPKYTASQDASALLIDDIKDDPSVGCILETTVFGNDMEADICTVIVYKPDTPYNINNILFNVSDTTLPRARCKLFLEYNDYLYSSDILSVLKELLEENDVATDDTINIGDLPVSDVENLVKLIEQVDSILDSNHMFVGFSKLLEIRKKMKGDVIC